MRVAVWWVVLMACWVATLATLAPVELAVGAAGALIAAGTAVAAQRALRRRWSFDPRWLRWLVLVPLTALTESALLLTLIRRERRKRSPGLRRLARPEIGGGARADGHRALGGAVLSAAPGSYLVDWPGDAQRPVLLHTVVSGWPRLDEEVLS
jgi:multisubunit Na+/H+ antiporter MnhE subunit